MADLFGIDEGKVDGSATVSGCGRYRYELWRRWGHGPTCAFIMLNPSTADDVQNDPTIRRCIGFARSWDFGCLLVGNLFALRSTQPEALFDAEDPIGPMNNHALEVIVRTTDMVVVAWGAFGPYLGRDAQVLRLIHHAGGIPLALRLTKERRQPAHPLYLPADLKPQPLETFP